MFGRGLATLLCQRMEAMRDKVESLGGEWDDSLYAISSPDRSFKNPETLGKEW